MEAENNIFKVPKDYVNPYPSLYKPEYAEDNKLALNESLYKFGKVDMDYMAALIGEPLDKTIKLFENILFRDPELCEGKFNKGFVTS